MELSNNLKMSSSVLCRVAPDLIFFSNPAGAGFGIADPAGAGAECSWAAGLGYITYHSYVTSNEIQTETRMWVWFTCPWWNREVQITKFVKQWIPAQLHSEADASKDGQIRPGRIWKYGRISAGAGCDIRCNPSALTLLIWSSGL